MGTIQPLTRAPENLDEFVEDMSRGMAELYGPEAGVEYRRDAGLRLRHTFSHPAVLAYSLSQNGTVVGVAVALLREGFAHVMLVHLLPSAEGEGADSHLVARLLDELRGRGVGGILSEFLPLYSASFAQAFITRGFTPIERAVLVKPLNQRMPAEGTLNRSIPLEESDDADAAAVFEAAWREHAGRQLHPEMHSVAGAREFLQMVRRGSYGEFHRPYLRCIKRSNRVEACVAGARAAPNTGFILHIATAPAAQGLGHGTTLIADVEQAFLAKGLTEAALGVTKSNPAIRLYERLGYRERRAVTAYAWWRG